MTKYLYRISAIHVSGAFVDNSNLSPAAALRRDPAAFMALLKEMQQAARDRNLLGTRQLNFVEGE